jgi:hypothetical protein
LFCRHEIILQNISSIIRRKAHPPKGLSALSAPNGRRGPLPAAYISHLAIDLRYNSSTLFRAMSGIPTSNRGCSLSQMNSSKLPRRYFIRRFIELCCLENPR